MAVPSDYSNLVQWFKADAGVYKDAGTTLAADTETVQQWNDQSGNANHGTQATANNRPQYRTNQLNGKPAIIFDGGAQGVDNANYKNLGIGGPLSGASAGEVFIVLKLDADPPPHESLSALWHYTLADYAAHVPYSDGTIYDNWGTTVRKTVGNPTASLASAYRVYNVRSASGAWSAHLDGTQLHTTGTNTVSFVASGGVLGTVLANTSAPSLTPDDWRFDGGIAEVVIYSRVLDASERTGVMDYFTLKYFTAFSAALGGTVVTEGATEEDIVAGGKTITLTLTGATWPPA